MGISTMCFLPNSHICLSYSLLRMCIRTDELETAKSDNLFKSHYVYLSEAYTPPLL